MPRGGKRAGAGAPRPVLSPVPTGVEGGNLNALRTGKHGVYPERCGSSSRRAQYKRLLEILSRDQEAVRLLEEIALGDQKRLARRRREACPEPGASRSRRAMQVLAQVLKQQEIHALDRVIDEWERRRTIPTSVLDIPDPSNFLSRRNGTSRNPDACD